MKKLYRSRKNKLILGVCAGIGDYFCLDPFFIRILALFFATITIGFPALLLYFICALIIPNEPKGYHVKPYKRLYRSQKDCKIAGVCGGIAETFGWDSTLVRIICAVFFILSGILPMLIGYIIGWATIPKRPFHGYEVEIE